MRKKGITKIICTAVAAISALTLAVAPACSANWKGVSGDKETATSLANVSSNGGFLVETGDYVYFINGMAANTDTNNFGTVLKGSVQRIKKSAIEGEEKNYVSETVVPSVIYSGSYNAGIYIYGDYIYYTTPTTEKNTDGEVLNSNLDFKRTKVDGTDTSKKYIWQCSDNAVDYRFVEVDDVVYIIYALSENLYGSSKTNIHSVNCNTGVNTILAYGVSDYAFDTVDRENPYIYYTMSVPQYFGGSSYGYNQMYRVSADVTESPREYDFSAVEDYDPDEDPVYINMGDFVFDGIGLVNNETDNRITQLNYAHYSNKEYELLNDDYTYDIKWYKDGTLYYSRKSTGGSSSIFTLTNSQVDKNGDGKIAIEEWDAVEENRKQTVFLSSDSETDYTYVTMDGKLYAVNAGSSGITKSVVEDGKLGKSVTIDGSATSATVLTVREEGEGANKHFNLYYLSSGIVNRIAIDGAESDYRELEADPDTDWTYESVKILDIATASGWYNPEFVGNNLFFASATEGMNSFNYIMVCNLEGKNGIMTNNEIDELSDKYRGITEKIEEYDSETNTDGSAAYDGLSSALKYAFYTGDAEYIDTLVQAYVDIEDRDIEYIYSKESVRIYKDFINVEGDWSSYKEDSKKINGETVYSNSHDYYYHVVGQMTEADAEDLVESFKSSYMKEYPVDDSTWWDNLTTGGKVGFIIGMVVCGLLVIGGVTFLVIFLVKRKNAAGEGVTERKMKVDITDDKDVDVYGDGDSAEGGENPADGE